MAPTSIIIPSHDRPEMLRRAIESARRSGSDVEIVVVDDASLDGTREVCASFDDIVYVRREERGGVARARADGIAASSGAFISFLDDDDVRIPGSIDQQVAVLQAAPDAALVYAQAYRGNQDLETRLDHVTPQSCPSGDVFWTLLGSNFIPSGTVVVRRGAVDEAGGIDPACSPADDWDLWIRISERHPIAALPEPVIIYREPTLWSNQGSSRLANGLLQADIRVHARCATLPRAIANPAEFRRSARTLRRLNCNRLLAESFDAARRKDPYVWVGLGHAVRTAPGAVLRALVSPQTWKKLLGRLRS